MWTRSVVWLVFAVLCTNSAFADEKKEKNLAIFNVVKFKNEPCVSTSSTMNNGNRNGTCYTSEECEERGGRAEGNCAMGFGTCCVFTFQKCGETANQNCTYIRNENFPTAVTTAGSCEYKIEKCDDAVCTLRLDFEEFSIASWAAAAGGAVQTDTDFTCATDTFVVSNLQTKQTVPTICGVNTGQHMYLDLGPDSNSGATLTFTFGAATQDRTFEIKITQLACDSPTRPPVGCLQYFVGTEGRIKSFNWDGGNGHLPDQDYTMCIRQEKGFCCTKYSLCPSENGLFSLFLSGKTETPPMATALIEQKCTADYVIIEGSSSTCNLNTNTNRYCGNALNDLGTSVESVPICDCTTPFQLSLKTDSNAAMDMAAADTNAVSKGLCLDYVQEPCKPLV